MLNLNETIPECMNESILLLSSPPNRNNAGISRTVSPTDASSPSKYFYVHV